MLKVAEWIFAWNNSGCLKMIRQWFAPKTPTNTPIRLHFVLACHCLCVRLFRAHRAMWFRMKSRRVWRRTSAHEQDEHGHLTNWWSSMHWGNFFVYPIDDKEKTLSNNHAFFHHLGRHIHQSSLRLHTVRCSATYR